MSNRAASLLLVNHRVVMSATAEHDAVAGSRLYYISHRPGSVATPSAEDRRADRDAAVMARLGYIGYRPGAQAEPGTHALFDADGVPDRATVARELAGTDSAIVTSVISVRREDAARMHLETRDQWERLLRAGWRDYVSFLGVIAPEDVRWVAAMHVKSNTIHCHIFTWDRSERFSSLLPKGRLEPARATLQRLALGPDALEADRTRSDARDELVAGVRRSVGAYDLENVRRALPRDGRISYASISHSKPSARVVVDDVVRRTVASDPALADALARHRDATGRLADRDGLTGEVREAYISAADADLRRRLGNAVIRAAVPDRERAGQARADARATRRGRYAPPERRRRARAIREEAESCLPHDERGRLVEGVRQVREGTASAATRAEAARLLGRLPSVGRSAARGAVRGVARCAFRGAVRSMPVACLVIAAGLEVAATTREGTAVRAPAPVEAPRVIRARGRSHA